MVNGTEEGGRRQGDWGGGRGQGDWGVVRGGGLRRAEEEGSPRPGFTVVLAIS